MLKEEWIPIVKVLKASYTNEHFIPDKESNLVWYEMLKDIDARLVKKAVIDYVSTEHFPPTIADIRTRAVKIYVDVDDWSKAWGNVVKLISAYGRMDFKGAKEKMNDLEIETCNRLGWQTLCTSENINYERNNFKNVYEQVAEGHLKQFIEGSKALPNLELLGDGNAL